MKCVSWSDIASTTIQEYLKSKILLATKIFNIEANHRDFFLCDFTFSLHTPSLLASIHPLYNISLSVFFPSSVLKIFIANKIFGLRYSRVFVDVISLRDTHFIYLIEMWPLPQKPICGIWVLRWFCFIRSRLKVYLEVLIDSCYEVMD